MKKVYDIKIKDLEEILSVLESNMFDSSVVSDVIRLTEYIKRLKNDFKPVDSITTYEQLIDDLEYYDFYKPFYPITKRFAESGLRTDSLTKSVSYKVIHMRDTEVVSDVEEFYSHQGSVFHSLFLDYKDEVQDHLKFIKESSDTEGETLFIKSIGEAFVFSPNYSNITKFTILVHEIQHVIDFYLNPNFSEEFVIREAIAMFMEMISADFFADKYKLFGENNKRLQFLHSVVKAQAYNAVQKMKILKIANNSNFKNEDLLFNHLSDHGYDKDELSFYFEQGITVDFSYQIAYLIAIELYVLYRRNPQSTIKICEDIIKNGNANNIFVLLDKYGIKLNNSVISFEKKIYKKR